MFNERRAKYAQEERQRALRAAQQSRARTPTPSEPDDSSSAGSQSHESSSSHSSAHPSSHHSSHHSSYHPSGESSRHSESYDTAEHSAPSEEHTDRADAYEADYFPIPTRRQFDFFDMLRQRKFENTRVVDFNALRLLGVEEEFIRLTSRIGITPTFWAIDLPGYKKLTHEFLSSLELKWNNNDRPYIKFQLGHQSHRLWVSTLRTWFGFEDDPQTASLSFREGLDKDHFWNLISGMEPGSVVNREFKGLNIPHPVLRIIQRVLAVTIFARGETASRANEQDLQLMDHMLRPDGELERPDLMLIMIHHWISQQRSRRTGGAITLSAYVTLIAERLEIPLDARDTCRGPRQLDIDSYRLYKYIQIEHGLRGRTLLWRMPDERTTFPLPFPVSLSFDDRSTWLFTQPPRAVRSHLSSPVAADVEMTDVQTSPTRVHAPTFSAGPSYPPDPTFSAGPSYPPDPTYSAGPSQPSDPTIQDLYHLISAMQTTQIDILTTQSAIQATLIDQGDSLSDIRLEFASQGARLSSVEDQLRDWRFYEEHGFWPDAPPH